MSEGRNDRKDAVGERGVSVEYDDCDFVREYIALEEAIRKKEKIDGKRAGAPSQQQECVREKIEPDHFDDQASYISMEESEFRIRLPIHQPHEKKEAVKTQETNKESPTDGLHECEIADGGKDMCLNQSEEQDAIRFHALGENLSDSIGRLFDDEAHKKTKTGLIGQSIPDSSFQDKTEPGPSNVKQMKIKDLILAGNGGETEDPMSEAGDKTSEDPNNVEKDCLLGASQHKIESSSDEMMHLREQLCEIKIPGENDAQSACNHSIQTEPVHQVQKKRTPAERMAISDTEDISTDNDFIRVNIIDTRKTTFNVPKHSSEKKDVIYKADKSADRRIKVNRHVIDRNCRVMASETLPISPVHADYPVDEQKEAQEQETFLEDNNTQSTAIIAVPDPAQNVEAAVIVENESDSKFSAADAVVLIAEVKRHIIHERSADSVRPVNRFVLGTKRPIIDINDIIEINDFRERDLYDKLQRRTTRGRFSHCWVRVVNGLLLCYRSKGINDPHLRFTENSFPDPENLGTLYEKKYAIDLSESRLLLSKEQKWPWLGFMCCCSAPLDPAQLLDITNAKIRRITHEASYYAIDMQDNGASFTLRLRSLDFVFEFEENFYCFRAASIDTFLKWVLTYHLRRSRGICRIERLVDEDD